MLNHEYRSTHGRIMGEGKPTKDESRFCGFLQNRIAARLSDAKESLERSEMLEKAHLHGHRSGGYNATKDDDDPFYFLQNAGQHG